MMMVVLKESTRRSARVPPAAGERRSRHGRLRADGVRRCIAQTRPVSSAARASRGQRAGSQRASPHSTRVRLTSRLAAETRPTVRLQTGTLVFTDTGRPPAFTTPVLMKDKLHLLWSPYGIGQTIIFSCCGLFFLLLFFLA